MPSRKNLMMIERNPRLKKAWIGYLESKQLDRAYSTALMCKDTRFFFEQFMKRMTGSEQRAFKRIRNAAITIGDKVNEHLSKKIPEKLGMSQTDFADRAKTDSKLLKQYEDAFHAHKSIVTFMEDAKQSMLNTFNDLADSDSFKNSNYYSAYLKSAVDPRTLGREMDLLEFEVDDILKMAVAVQTGDTSTANRMSKQIAKSHKAKKGKAFSAAEIFKKMTGALKKKKL